MKCVECNKSNSRYQCVECKMWFCHECMLDLNAVCPCSPQTIFHVEIMKGKNKNET